MRRVRNSLVAIAFSLGLSAPSASAQEVYRDFPITVSGYSGSATTSVSYDGQVARHLLHESLKKLAASGSGAPNSALEEKMLTYFESTAEGRAILAPTSNGEFVFTQLTIDEISKGKNLAGKMYKGAVHAWPRQMSASEVVKFWIQKAAFADGGYDVANGYNYAQLISKFIMGALFFNQIADVYLDENLLPDTKPNNEPYKPGAAYTGKEHSWDEAFGYFGAAAHTSRLTAKQSYEMAKRGTKSESPAVALELADHDNDGRVDYSTEMTYALAYYASSYDKSGKSDYLDGLFQAFLQGRQLLTEANGKVLSDEERRALTSHAVTIVDGLETVLAESVFKYAGEAYEDLQTLQAVLDADGNIDKVLKDYIKHWSELKGFSMALQVGGKDLGETALKMNRLIGFGPALPNSSQVTDIDSANNYVKEQGPDLQEYALHLLKVQKLMTDNFNLQAKSHDQLGQIGDLIEQLGSGSSAEND